MSTTNDQLFKEINQVKIILIGDGTPESVEDSIQYRLIQVETIVKPKLRKTDGNGGYVERRTIPPVLPKKTWKQQFKELTLYKKVAMVILLIPFIGSNLDWLLNFLHKGIDILQAFLK